MSALVDLPLPGAIGLALLVIVAGLAVWDAVQHDKRVDAVLGHLLMRGESYGLAMVKESGGVLRRGTVYVLLGQLERQGLVASREESSTPSYIGIPRRLYRLTWKGRGEAIGRALAAAAVESAPPREGVSFAAQLTVFVLCSFGVVCSIAAVLLR